MGGGIEQAQVGLQFVQLTFLATQAFNLVKYVTVMLKCKNMETLFLKKLL